MAHVYPGFQLLEWWLANRHGIGNSSTNESLLNFRCISKVYICNLIYIYIYIIQLYISYVIYITLFIFIIHITYTYAMYIYICIYIYTYIYVIYTSNSRPTCPFGVGQFQWTQIPRPFKSWSTSWGFLSGSLGNFKTTSWGTEQVFCINLKLVDAIGVNMWKISSKVFLCYRRMICIEKWFCD